MSKSSQLGITPRRFKLLLLLRRLRDLNDEINKLIREKNHWQDRILELGGPDYRKVGPKMLDHEGKEVPGNRGYK